MKSLDDGYAQAALDSVQRAADSGYGQAYGSLCHRFPAMVLLNGLRLAAAFYQAQTKGAHTQYIRDLGIAIGIQDWDKLPENSMEYRNATRSALRAAVWFKRYAEAILKVRNARESEQ